MRDFVGQTELPAKRPLVVIPLVPPPASPPGEIWLFKLSYGTAHDCPAGCFYSTGVGIQNFDKIGWVVFHDYDETDLSSIPLYEFDGRDAPLFTPEMFREIEAADWHFFHHAFLRKLGASTAVGSAPLAAAAYELFDRVNLQLAQILIQNPIVRGDQEILLILASLPEFVGDPYAGVREEAQGLLGTGG